MCVFLKEKVAFKKENSNRQFFLQIVRIVTEWSTYLCNKRILFLCLMKVATLHKRKHIFKNFCKNVKNQHENRTFTKFPSAFHSTLNQIAIKQKLWSHQKTIENYLNLLVSLFFSVFSEQDPLLFSVYLSVRP